MIRKRSIALLLALTMILAVPMSVSAGTNSGYYNGRKVTANCGTNSSWHQVTGGSYPTAVGRLYFHKNGQNRNEPTYGASYSTYWYGPVGPIQVSSTRHATTTYSGFTVTAY